MEDLSFWYHCKDFSVFEVAYLWCEMEPPPTAGSYESTPARVQKVWDMIYYAVQDGELKPQIPGLRDHVAVRVIFDNVFQSDDESERIIGLGNIRFSRVALRKWVENQNHGYYPRFLFPEAQQLAPAESLASHSENLQPVSTEPSESKYENLLKAFGLLVQLYVDRANRGGKKYGTADNPTVSQIAEDICQKADNLGLLDKGATGLRKSSVQEKIREALQKLKSF